MYEAGRGNSLASDIPLPQEKGSLQLSTRLGSIFLDCASMFFAFMWKFPSLSVYEIH
jgi:hypothetical protein